MKKTLFILSLLAVSLFGVSACQEMFDDNGNVNWGDISTETGTCTDSCTGTGTCEGNEDNRHCITGRTEKRRSSVLEECRNASW